MSYDQPLIGHFTIDGVTHTIEARWRNDVQQITDGETMYDIAGVSFLAGYVNGYYKNYGVECVVQFKGFDIVMRISTSGWMKSIGAPMYSELHHLTELVKECEK